MAQFELRMPKMGESIIEATILSWSKDIGDAIEAEETLLEIATDKVDSEVPAPVDGKLLEKRFAVNDVVPVGEVIAIIETEGAVDGGSNGHADPTEVEAEALAEPEIAVPYVPGGEGGAAVVAAGQGVLTASQGDRFLFSPGAQHRPGRKHPYGRTGASARYRTQWARDQKGHPSLRQNPQGRPPRSS